MVLVAGGMAGMLVASGVSVAARPQVKRSASGSGPISWWVPSPSPIPGTLHAAAKAFTKKTGIQVNVESVPWSSYLTKLTTAIASGQGPDVAEIGNTWSSTFANTGGFLPWTSSMFKAIGGEGKFLKTSMGVTGIPGKPPISVPFLGQTWVMLYNKGLFKKAGIASPPRTWAQFNLDAKKLTDPSKGVYALAYQAGSSSALGTWMWIMFRQFGGNMYNAKGQVDLTSPQDVNAVTQLVRWVYPLQFVNPANVADSTGTIATTEFEQGKAAMYFNQSPNVAKTPPGGYGLSYIPLEEPTPPGGAKIMSHVAGENLAIFDKTTHLAEDLEFINFLTSPAEQASINQKMYELPVTPAGLKAPAFQTPTEKIFGEILAKYAAPMPTNASSANVQLDMSDAMISLERTDIGSHNITPSAVKAALASAQATVQAAG